MYWGALKWAIGSSAVRTADGFQRVQLSSLGSVLKGRQMLARIGGLRVHWLPLRSDWCRS